MSELNDLEAIRRLTYEYAMAVDTMQLDKLIDLFVPEAVFDPGPGGVPVMNDRDEIEAFFKATFEGSRNLYHLTSNHIIDLDGDSATGTVYYAASGVTRRRSELRCQRVLRRHLRADRGRLEVPAPRGRRPARSRLQRLGPGRGLSRRSRYLRLAASIDPVSIHQQPTCSWGAT